ncbi:MAG: cupredoxin domain-containing protein [Nanoarchaeota archaeon]
MKTILLAAIIVVLIAGAAVFVLSAGKSNGNDAPIQQVSQTQDRTLSFQNRNYYPQTLTVKAGQPVRITLDASVRGCYRSFTIRALGISKYSSSPADVIEFVPTQPGTYRFACSMGMGTGTIIVE